MALKELDSFVFKLKGLWKAGRDAALTVETNAGQAWVHLRVGLGGLEQGCILFPPI